jgi:hypothetical protein
MSQENPPWVIRDALALAAIAGRLLMIVGFGIVIIIVVVAMALAMLDRHTWVCKVHEKARGEGIKVMIPFWGRKIYAISATGAATLELMLDKQGFLKIKTTQEPAFKESLARHITLSS